jgi:hypothetical protein
MKEPVTMTVSDFLPEEESEARKSRPVLLTDKEQNLFRMYGKEKGWKVTTTMRICTKAVILLEYQMANSLIEALKKAEKLDIDGRKKK